MRKWYSLSVAGEIEGRPEIPIIKESVRNSLCTAP